MRTRIKSFFDRPFALFFVIPTFMYFLVEILGRHSFFSALAFTFSRPHVFIVNLAFVMLTYSAALFVRRKIFCYTLTSVIWLTLGIVNCVLIFMRNSPFNASDLAIFKYGIMITNRYMSPFQIVLVIAAILAATVVCILLFRRAPKYEGEIRRVKCAVLTGSVAALCVSIAAVCILTGEMSFHFENLSDGFDKNGFPFSFFASGINHGVEQPEDYAEDTVAPVIAELDRNYPESSAQVKPDVIFVQLESFFDPKSIKGLHFESDPIPNFTAMRDNCISGRLSVPVVGGGTSNTEFEVLTGMSLDYFGTVEYPYESFLRTETCPSAAYTFADLGYKSTAIHDFSADFYRRSSVYPMLGFERFISLEYMSGVEYNSIGWAKDKILQKYIDKTLELDGDDPSFIFTVSVQGHGMYPDHYDADSSPVAITYDEDSAAVQFKNKIAFYCEQINEMDAFIGALTEGLSAREKPTVLVLYGDHLPGITFTPEMLECDMYQTDYIVWSNYGLQGEGRDLETWQLMAYVQELIGMKNGVMSRFHQYYRDNENYLRYLQLMQFDIVDGDKVALGGKTLEPITDMKFGCGDPTIDSITIDGENTVISGRNFTEYSAAYIDGSRNECVFVDENTLILEDEHPDDGDVVYIGVLNYHNPFKTLSNGEMFVYRAPVEDAADSETSSEPETEPEH